MKINEMELPGINRKMVYSILPVVEQVEEQGPPAKMANAPDVDEIAVMITRFKLSLYEFITSGQETYEAPAEFNSILLTFALGNLMSKVGCGDLGELIKDLKS